jgi:lipopolysaccharide heptosyltransferase II
MGQAARPSKTSRAAAWREAHRVLCVRLDNAGDVLMTTPAIRALRHADPKRRITLLASPSGSAVAPYVPEIDDTTVFEAPWIKGDAQPRVEASDDLIKTLQGGQYDAAVIFTVYSQSALAAAYACWLARIPLRLAHARENPYGLLSDWAPEPEPHTVVRHEVRRQLDLVAGIGCRAGDERLSFHVPDREARSALRVIAAAGVDLSRPWIVVHPGATAPSRRYPPECYARACASIASDYPDYQILVTGSAREAQIVRTVAASSGPTTHAIAGMLNLGELASVIQRAKLLISNNTGPAHLAAAVGTPVVDLYALTNPQHVPWKVPSRVLYHDVPCRFCYRSVCTQQHHACLKLVSPERVSVAARELLAQQAERVPVARTDDSRGIR